MTNYKAPTIVIKESLEQFKRKLYGPPPSKEAQRMLEVARRMRRAALEIECAADKLANN